METDELRGASGSTLMAFALLFLRTLSLKGFWSSGEFELAVALAAMVFLRESALLNAACDRMARRKSPFWVSEGTVILMNILLHCFKAESVVFDH